MRLPSALRELVSMHSGYVRTHANETNITTKGKRQNRNGSNEKNIRKHLSGTMVIIGINTRFYEDRYGEQDGRHGAAARTPLARGNSCGEGPLIADARRHCMCPCDTEKRIKNTIGTGAAAATTVATAVASAVAVAATVDNC